MYDGGSVHHIWNPAFFSFTAMAANGEAVFSLNLRSLVRPLSSSATRIHELYTNFAGLTPQYAPVCLQFTWFNQQTSDCFRPQLYTMLALTPSSSSSIATSTELGSLQRRSHSGITLTTTVRERTMAVGGWHSSRKHKSSRTHLCLAKFLCELQVMWTFVWAN